MGRGFAHAVASIKVVTAVAASSTKEFRMSRFRRIEEAVG